MRVRIDDAGRPYQEKTDRKTGRVYRYPVAAGKVPEDWWTDIETLNHSDKERVGWPSQKPVRLVTRCLAAVTQPGDLVADWFAGSGTTARKPSSSSRNPSPSTPYARSANPKAASVHVARTPPCHTMSHPKRGVMSGADGSRGGR